MKVRDFFDPIWVSLKVSTAASVIVFVLGFAAAWWMTYRNVKGKLLWETFFMLPLVLPPSVVGLILLTVFGRNSWIGKGIETLFSQTIVFSWWGAVLAAVVVSFPLVYRMVKTAFASVEPDLLDAAKTMGANEWQILRHVIIPMNLPSLAAGYLLGFARGLGEFGATLMIAGNIPGKTQTLPTAVYVAVESGNMTLAWMWTGAIVLISFLIVLLIRKHL